MSRSARDMRRQLIGGVSLFSSCTDKEIAHIAALTDELDAPAGAVLTREGVPGRECFVVIEGQADVSVQGGSVAELGPGSFFGEMALLEPAPRSATVTARSPMRLLVLSPSALSELLDRHPVVTRRMLTGLAVRLRRAEHAPTY